MGLSPVVVWWLAVGRRQVNADDKECSLLTSDWVVCLCYSVLWFWHGMAAAGV